MIEFNKEELIVLDNIISDEINNMSSISEELLYKISSKINDALDNIEYDEIGV